MKLPSEQLVEPWWDHWTLPYGVWMSDHFLVEFCLWDGHFIFSSRPVCSICCNHVTCGFPFVILCLELSERQGQQREARCHLSLKPQRNQKNRSKVFLTNTVSAIDISQWPSVCLSFLWVRSRSGGPSGVSDSRRRSQHHLHRDGEPEGGASSPCCGLWWQRPSLWHPLLCSQILWGGRVRISLPLYLQGNGSLFRV